jgi:hypothetical protein
MIKSALGRWKSAQPPLALRGALALLVCLVGVVIYARVVGERYPLANWVAWDLLQIWGWTLALTTGYLSLGALVFTRVFEARSNETGSAEVDRSPFRALLFSAALGLIAWCWAMYLAGAVGLFRGWFMVALVVASLVVGGKALWRVLQRCLTHWQAAPPAGVLGWLATGWGCFCVVLMYLQCMTPDSLNYDGSWYHLPIAQDYAREGRIVPFYSEYNRCFPHLASFIHTFGFTIPGMRPELRWMMALTVEFTIVLWKVFGVLVAAQWLIGKSGPRGLWSAFFLFPSVFIYDQNIGGSADHFMGFFAAPVFLALVMAAQRFETRALVLLGMLLGGALLTKYQAVYVLGVSAAILGLRWAHLALRLIRKSAPSDSTPSLSWRSLFLAAAYVALPTLIVSSPHFIKNIVFYHNPVYPFNQGLFPSNPSHEKSKFFMDYTYANYPYLPKGEGLEKIWNAVKLFFTFSFVPHYSFTKHYVSMGSLFTLLLPTIVLVRGKGRLAVGVLASFVGIMCWALTYVGDRYLQAIIALPIAVTAALLVRVWEIGKVARIGLASLVAFQVIWGSDAMFYSGQGRLKSALALITSGYDGHRSVEERYPQYKVQRQITTATPESAVIMVRNYRALLGLDRMTLGDVPSWQSLFFYEPLKGTRSLYDMYKDAGVTHLLYPPNQRVPATLQASILFDDLVYNYCKKRKRFGSLELVEMPKEAPPPDPEEYRVLNLAKDGYALGWYQIDQLREFQRVPRKLRTVHAPRARYSVGMDAKALNAELDKTLAVVVAAESDVSPALRERLGLSYFRAEKFKAYTVYLRKR